MEKKKLHRWRDLQRQVRTPEEIAQSDADAEKALLDLDLRKLRELTGKTQEEVASVAQMTQTELSRFERREDHRVSTLRRIVEALGGRLEVIAVFDDKQVRLNGV